jgi:hypothetical protein
MEMTQKELAEAIDKAYQEYVYAFYKLEASTKETYELWRVYRELWLKACDDKYGPVTIVSR